jgi:hypothetical protein
MCRRPTNDYPQRINASDFCVQWSRRSGGTAFRMPAMRLFAPARIGEMPDEAFVCPFPAQSVKKLMQKIHRLTDN